MNETLEYIKMFAEFPFALRRYLKYRMTPEKAESILRERMKQREQNLLRVIERGVFGYAPSPYLQLLKQAGCEFGDVQTLVRQKGVEGALRELREEGVYVTYEEFKGRKPIVRGGWSLEVEASDFDNPHATRSFTTPTGGTTGLATNVAMSLDYFANKLPHQLVFLQAHGLIDAPTAYWLGILPGSGFQFVLQRTDLDKPIHEWFSYLGWRESRYWVKYGLATVYMVAWMRALGARCVPREVKLDQPMTVVRWMQHQLEMVGRCVVHTNPSHALRIAIAAQQAGIDLTGAAVRVGGEPLTPAKAGTMKRVGLKVVMGYGMTETSTSAMGCAHPVGADDYHLLLDSFALITHPYPVAGFEVTVPAFNMTTLLASSPKLLLNMQSDDYGIVEERACGCEFEKYGLTTHLREIRSYSKLVGEGVTLIGNEFVRILEEVLPARFQASALDFQLMEEEDEKGFTRLYLLIHPRVEIADEAEVIETVLTELRNSSPMADAARTVWTQAQTLRVQRRAPVWTSAGKLMPLYINRVPRG